MIPRSLHILKMIPMSLKARLLQTMVHVDAYSAEVPSIGIGSVNSTLEVQPRKLGPSSPNTPQKHFMQKLNMKDAVRSTREDL